MRNGRRRWLPVAWCVATAVAVSSCSSGAQTTTAAPTTAPTGTSGSTGSSGSSGTSPTTAATRPACDRPLEAAPAAAAVDGAPADRDVTSFDGATIRAHWFPLPSASAASTAPTILMGPGWSLPGDSNENAVGVFGAVNIARLRQSGFNVLTWDPRGFGKSGGTAEVNSKDFEGRDVQVLLNWVAAQPGVRLDAPGDPRAGMIGGSYGGGIQLITAAIDCRVDALVPIVAWHSLSTSLAKAGTAKIGWANILTKTVTGRSVDAHTTHANTTSNDSGVIEPEDLAWFESRGPGDLVADVKVPTLFVQGTVDTLFTLDEGITNYRILRDHGVPVSMVWYCGGHGTCLSAPADIARIEKVAMAWLERYVKDDATVDTGSRIDLIDQNGASYRADDYPVAAGPPVTASGSGTLALVADGGAGPATAPAAAGDVLHGLVLPVTPGKANNAVNVSVAAAAAPALLVGAPKLDLTYQGTVGAGARPTRVFAQLVDEASGLVLGNQITPIAVTLDGAPHTASVELEVIAHAMTPSTRLTLQLVATTVAYAPPRLGGSITFDKIELALPTAADLKPAP